MSHTTCVSGISGVSARLADLPLRLVVVVGVSGRPPFRRVSLAIPLADTDADLLVLGVLHGSDTKRGRRAGPPPDCQLGNLCHPGFYAA